MTSETEIPRMKRATAIALLNKERKWVRLQREVDAKPDEVERAHKAMTFAVRVINACGSRINKWAYRKEGQLSDLRNVRGTFTDVRGNESLLELLRLAVTTLEAATWVADVPCREYPVKAPRIVSKENLQAMLEAKRQKAAAEQETRRRLIEARQEAISVA